MYQDLIVPIVTVSIPFLIEVLSIVEGSRTDAVASVREAARVGVTVSVLQGGVSVDLIVGRVGGCGAGGGGRNADVCPRRRRVRWFFFFSSRRRHTRLQGDWSSDVCSSDLSARYPGARNGRSRTRHVRRVDCRRDTGARCAVARRACAGSEPSGRAGVQAAAHL